MDAIQGRSLGFHWAKEKPRHDPWDCHICRPIDPQNHPNVGIYGIHGVSGKRKENMSEPHNLEATVMPWMHV